MFQSRWPRPKPHPESVDYLHDMLISLTAIEGLLTGMANALDTVNDNLSDIKRKMEAQ